MGQNNAFSGHFGALNRAFQAIFDVPSNRLIPTNTNKWLSHQPFVIYRRKEYV